MFGRIEDAFMSAGYSAMFNPSVYSVYREQYALLCSQSSIRMCGLA